VAIAEALYPILFPSAPAEAEKRKAQYAEVEHLATMVWNAFSGKYTPSLSDITAVHWGGLNDLFHSIGAAAKRASNAAASAAGTVVHMIPEAITDMGKAHTEPEVPEKEDEGAAPSTAPNIGIANSPLVSGVIRAEAAAQRATHVSAGTQEWAKTLYPTGS
jgi:hypothetical protein